MLIYSREEWTYMAEFYSRTTETEVSWFDAGTIDECVWPQTEHAQFIRSYWLPFIKNGPSLYIKNVKTTPLLLRIDDLCLPITVNAK